jgi:sulfur carrier protein
VNDRDRTVGEEATLADLVAALGRDPRRPGAAVAVNGEVVPRAAWPEHRLREGDRVEVLAASQGG